MSVLPSTPVLGRSTPWRRSVTTVSQESDGAWVGSMPEAYERWLARAVFRPFAVDLAGRVRQLAPGRVLELAAGTGVLTRELLASGPSVEVTATDLNTAMVDFGRRRAAGARWQQADAQDLPFDDASFDVVACQFGVMFFPHKPKAFSEARRVLLPDGRFLFSTWGPIEANDFASALDAGVRRALPDDPPMFIAVPHGYADLDVVAADLAGSGFDCVAAETITLEGGAESARDVAMGFCTGTPLRFTLERHGDVPGAIAIIVDEMKARLGRGEVLGRMTAHIVDAALFSAPPAGGG